MSDPLTTAALRILWDLEVRGVPGSSLSLTAYRSEEGDFVRLRAKEGSLDRLGNALRRAGFAFQSSDDGLRIALLEPGAVPGPHAGDGLVEAVRVTAAAHVPVP